MKSTRNLFGFPDSFADADHSFHVPARTGRKDADVRTELLDAMADWVARIATKKS